MTEQRENEFWSWRRCKTKIRSLRGELGFKEASTLEFLALELSLENGVIYDKLGKRPFPEMAPSIYCILSSYADAKPFPENAKLVSFRQLPGGHAYHIAFLRRTVSAIQKTFEQKPELLVEAARLLGGSKTGYGDFSAKVYALPLVPLVVVLWAGSSEFPASANMLFDASVSRYLSTEQAAMLGELTLIRLRHASQALKSRVLEESDC